MKLAYEQFRRYVPQFLDTFELLKVRSSEALRGQTDLNRLKEIIVDSFDRVGGVRRHRYAEFDHGSANLDHLSARAADYRSKTITDALHMVQFLKRYGREF